MTKYVKNNMPNESKSRKKIYCYVDESGQDIQSQNFIVAVVVLLGEQVELLKWCEDREQDTGKGKLKWGTAKEDLRLKYLHVIFSDRRFHQALRYVINRKPVHPDVATIESIARAIEWQAPPDYEALIYVDALAKTKCREYTMKLRQRGIKQKKVRGVRKDENNALVRLADAVAGFVRDIEEGRVGRAKILFEKAKQAGFLIEV